MNCLFLILAICDEHYPKTAFSFFVKSLLGQQCTDGASGLSSRILRAISLACVTVDVPLVRPYIRP